MFIILPVVTFVVAVALATSKKPNTILELKFPNVLMSQMSLYQNSHEFCDRCS
jgi:hypothetical protein